MRNNDTSLARSPADRRSPWVALPIIGLVSWALALPGAILQASRPGLLFILAYAVGAGLIPALIGTYMWFRKRELGPPLRVIIFASAVMLALAVYNLTSEGP